MQEAAGHGGAINRYAAAPQLPTEERISTPPLPARLPPGEPAPLSQDSAWLARSGRFRYENFAKPVIDFVGALVLLIVLLPVLVVIAVVLALSMGRPVLFKQERVGRGGKRFIIWKFRTMVPDRRVAPAAHYAPERRIVHKTLNDPRITRVGAVVRRWSLDELPQLWNVLCGDMSLIGPRPELVHIVERCNLWEHERHRVKPGITGLWQVSARRQGLMHENLHLDLEYVNRLSFKTDCLILLRTVKWLFGRLPGF